MKPKQVDSKMEEARIDTLKARRTNRCHIKSATEAKYEEHLNLKTSLY